MPVPAIMTRIWGNHKRLLVKKPRMSIDRNLFLVPFLNKVRTPTFRIRRRVISFFFDADFSIIFRSEKEIALLVLHWILWNKFRYTSLLSSIKHGGSKYMSFLTNGNNYVFFRSIQGERTSIGKNVCVCLLGGHVTTLFFMDKSYIDFSDVSNLTRRVYVRHKSTETMTKLKMQGHRMTLNCVC